MIRNKIFMIRGMIRSTTRVSIVGAPRKSRTQHAPVLRGIASLLVGAVCTARPAMPLHSAQAPATQPTDAWTEPRFAAHYTADWRGINVGTSDLKLEPDAAPGSYIYTWTVTARGVFRIVYSSDVVQKSWFSIVGDHVRPQKYRAEDGTSTANVDFDWDAGHARGQTERKPIDLKLSEGIQDIMSIQVEVMLDLKNGTLPKTFRILDKDEVKEFLYAVEGPARIRTALGELDTVIVSSRRSGNDRILRMWFAPSLQYVPVLAERSRGGKVEFTMKIKALESDAPTASAH